MRRVFKCGAFLGIVAQAYAAEFVERFDADPWTNGWQTFGRGDLFHWNAQEQALEVTWDSSTTNSYFYRPLGATLTKTDDFEFGCDLTLQEVRIGISPGKPFTFELAIGLLNFNEAANPNFWRGTGGSSPDIVEFNYFPDSGFGATISPLIISSNNQFVPSFTFPVELTIDDRFRIELRYTAAIQTLATRIWRNGEPYATIKDVRLGSTFTDFQIDTFAVTSYSDNGADGSLLAKGIVDNLSVIIPDGAIRDLRGQLRGGSWLAQFGGSTNWIYTLERTDDWRRWIPVSPPTPGRNGPQELVELDPLPARKLAFYRIRAERP